MGCLGKSDFLLYFILLNCGCSVLYYNLFKMKKILFGFSLLSLLVLFGCQSKNNPESCPVNGTGYSCNNETAALSLEMVES